MCGIAGFIGSPESKAAIAAVRDMLRALAHRGPDAEGIETFDGAVLGHRRLSIFDLSDAGRQPMMTPDRSVAVVFNGAIYNFIPLREELRSAGYRFVSNTDTEVLLHGYREWGLDRLVSRLRGMFAFGLWDHNLRTLYLVRDRLGVKPMVYASRGSEIVFASTPRALRWSGLAREIDAQAMAEYLEFGYVTDDRTIYRNVRKLPAASILEWREGKLSTREYWTPPPVDERHGPSFEEAVEESERLFLSSVKLRLEADVPVGALLSGGVDSSLICWAVARLGADITAFTVGAPGDALDETADARHTARTLGIRHEVIDLSPEETPDLDEMVAAYGEPFACASALGMLRVSRAVKRSATVLLTGDGGDDIFLGYPEHRRFWMAERLALKIPSTVGPLWRRARGWLPQHGMLQRGTHFLDYATGGLGAVTRAHPGLNVYQQREMLGDRLAQARIPAREIQLTTISARRLLTEFLAYDRRNRFVGEYMTKVDGGTMFSALEARSPFLDQEIWNFASRLPFGLRLRRGRLKAILRELAARHVSPRVANGRKRGFSIPVSKWLVGRWRSEFEDLFQRSLLEEEGWIRGGPVLKEFRKSVDLGSAPNSLWYLFVLENWLRKERQPLDRTNALRTPSEMRPVGEP
jgi:asparagine synthase (glutamine-hydrolysing)